MPAAAILRLLPPNKLVCLNRTLSSLSAPPRSSLPSMDSQSQPSSLLVLSGKSSAENDLAVLLKRNGALSLPDHGDFHVRLRSDLDSPSEEAPTFDVELYMNSFSTTRFGRFLIWSPRLSSTHDIVTKKFGELPVGSVCVADVQTKGRGRSANVWESPKGCLLFSYSIQMEDGQVVPLLQYVVSLAVTEAIKDVCDKKDLPQIDVRIKWPNDLYLNGLKVGGVLCTSTYTSKKFNVSAGIGLNVDNRQPTTCLNACLQDLASSSSHLRREEIMASFFNKFEHFFDTLLHQGFGPLEELYFKTWLHSGQRVIVKDAAEGEPTESVVTVQIVMISLPNSPRDHRLCVSLDFGVSKGLWGLTPSGYLLAVSDDGQTCELHPDGNSFDFFKGLIRRKLA